MITTDDGDLAERINMLRNHGASISEEQRHFGPRPYLLPEFNMLGYNYRMTELQGALGVVQLNKLDDFLGERRRWADFYREELSGIPWLKLPIVPEGYQHSWQAFVCYVDQKTAPMKRNLLMEKLQQNGISTRPGTHATHMLGLYQTLYGLDSDDYPVSRDCDRYTMAIPLHNRMSSDDYHRVVKELKSLGV